MTKRVNSSQRSCTDCFHCEACHLWSNGPIAASVAPKCQQFEPVRYVTLAELHEMQKTQKEEK